MKSKVLYLIIGVLMCVMLFQTGGTIKAADGRDNVYYEIVKWLDVTEMQKIETHEFYCEECQRWEICQEIRIWKNAKVFYPNDGPHGSFGERELIYGWEHQTHGCPEFGVELKDYEYYIKSLPMDDTPITD